MTIDRILQRIYPDDRELWPQIKQQLIENNPSSFVQNSDRLIPGQRLNLVDIKRILDPQDSPSSKRVGHVARLEGNASRIDEAGRAAKLQVNSPIFEHDRIETDPESRLRILMDDGAEAQLKGGTVLKITEYVITEDYDAGSSSIFDLLRGGLRKITGAIGASSEANYQMDAGVAAIGIRGTDYVIKLCRLDDCTQTVDRDNPEARLHAVVLDGAISLTTDDQARILLAKGEYATASPDSLAVEDRAKVPLGFLNIDESRQFDASAQQRAQNVEQESAGAWKWILGIMLLAVAL